MANPSTLFYVLLVGGLMGLLGQGIRAISGLKRMNDKAWRKSVRSTDLFVPRRLIISLAIGFGAGVLVTLLVGINKLATFNSDSPLVLLAIAAAGYAATDFFEGFLHNAPDAPESQRDIAITPTPLPPVSTGAPWPPTTSASGNSPRPPVPTPAIEDILRQIQQVIVSEASTSESGAASVSTTSQAAKTASFLYATNRKQSSDESYFSGERADEITYGAASVQIPDSHQMGKVELPFKLSLFSFTFYEETLNPQTHFIIKSVDVRPVEDWMNLISSSGKSDALVFVHGFNTTFRDAIYRAGQIFWDLQFSGIPVLFSWPSRGAVLDYIYDRDSALGARDSFIDVLRNLRSAGASRIDILAHSMGNLVVLDSLAGHRHTDEPLGIAEILMAAPDLDKDHYRSVAAKVRAAVSGMTLYASSADRALAASKRLAGNIARAGDVPEGGPVLVEGVDAIDVTAIGEELFGLGHSPYASTRSILNDIALLITAGMRPPNRRLVEMRGMPSGVLPPSWWRYIR